MGEKYLLAIDIGTTNTKGALFRLDGSIKYSAFRRHVVSSPQEGWAEHDAEKTWWPEVKAICRELVSKPGVSANEIAAIGISALSPALLPVDKNGRGIYPAMLYGLDRRAAVEIKELSEHYSALIQKHGQDVVSPLSTGPKILWLKRHEPEVFEKAAYFIGTPTYIVHRLTGQMVADYACYNINGIPFSRETFDWDDEMCSACGITRDRLPKLKWGTEAAGMVTKEAAAETGLAEGTLVAVGTGDFPAECLSYGTVFGSSIKISFGTTVGINFGSNYGLMLFQDYDYKHPRKNIQGGAMSNGCSTVDWMISRLSGYGNSDRIPDEKLQEMIDSVPAGSNGLVMLPYLNGEKTPFFDLDAKGVVFGLQTRHTQSELYRASIEALAYSVRQMLQRAPADWPKEAVVIGGGLKIPGLIQTVSDVTGYRLTKLEAMNGSLTGDAFIAGMACGVFHELKDVDSWIRVSGTVEPCMDNRDVYDKGFEKYLKLYEVTAELMHS